MATISTSSIQDNFTITVSSPVYNPTTTGNVSSRGSSIPLNSPLSLTTPMGSEIAYNGLSSYFRELTTTDLTNLKTSPIPWNTILPSNSMVLNTPLPVTSSVGAPIPWNTILPSNSMVLNTPIPIVNLVESSVPLEEVGIRTNSTFSGGSIYLSGTSGIYVQDPGSLYTLTTNTTIELWIKPTKLPSYGTVIGILSKRANLSINPANWITLALTDSGLLQLQVSGTSTSAGWGLTLTGTGNNISPGTWYHIAITKSSNTWTLYLNGAQYFTGTLADTVRDTTNTLVIGAYDSTGSNAFTGYITGVRYVVQTVVYTAPFTVPNYAPTNSATANQDAVPSASIIANNTDLLINPIYGTSTITDSSSNASTITGTYTISALSPNELLYAAKYGQNIPMAITTTVESPIYGLGGIATAPTIVTELWI